MSGINEEPMAIAVRDNRIHSLEVCALVLANEPIIYAALYAGFCFYTDACSVQPDKLSRLIATVEVLNWLNLC